jgi:hypothetical protein
MPARMISVDKESNDWIQSQPECFNFSGWVRMKIKQEIERDKEKRETSTSKA